MTMRHAIAYLASVALLAPSFALASTTTDLLSQLAGLFYIVVGLALVAAILLMIGGVIVWLLRFGTTNTFRDDAIRIMEWAVATLFTLVLVLGAVEFVQTHTSETLYILAICIILLLAWLVITSGIISGGGEKKEEE